MCGNIIPPSVVRHLPQLVAHALLKLLPPKTWWRCHFLRLHSPEPAVHPFSPAPVWRCSDCGLPCNSEGRAI